MADEADIRRGASLYSFQEEYFLRKFSLEDCIRTSVGLGALGIETVAEQMMPGFPHLPDSFYEQWHEWRRQYGFIPTAHNHFAELKLYKDRERPHEELVADLRLDIDHTVKLGATIVKTLAATPDDVVEAAAPYAAERGIRLLTEVHAPRRFDSDWFRGHLAVAERFPETVGFMPDLGIFVRKLPRVLMERAVRDGVDRSFVDEVAAVYEGGTHTAELAELAERPGLSHKESSLAYYASRFICEDPRVLLDYMPYIHHIQAKFYEMVDDTTEYSIPYPEIIDVLREGGFRGYVSSEYEGNRHIQDAFDVDSTEQVRRHQAMLASLLGEETD